MEKIKRILLSLFLLPFSLLSAQTIYVDLDLPSCRYLEYLLSFHKGASKDTVAIGHFDENGKASFALPSRNSDYRNVGVLQVLTTQKRGNVIFHRENKVQITEPVGAADKDELIIAISEENSFIQEIFKLYQEITKKYAYAYTVKEKDSLTKEYKNLREKILKSDLYAARLSELLICLTGQGSTLDLQPDSLLQEQYAYLTDSLDLQGLYSSGFWNLAIEAWYQSCHGDDSLLLEGSRRLLDRTQEIYLRRELTQTLIRMFSKYGKDNLFVALGPEYLTMPLNGQIAPEVIIDTLSFSPRKSLLVFYETGCGNCDRELKELKMKYPILLDNNIRVVSLSADLNIETYESTAQSLPWPGKYCDLKGFDGVNFQNYGVVGTPTLILTDENGIIRGRYSSVNELLK